MNIMRRVTCPGLVLSIGVLLAVLLPTEIHAKDPETKTEIEKEGASIVGQAIIELNVGVKQYLKGMELVLLPESVAGEIKEIRNTRWLESASRLNFNAGYEYLDLAAMGTHAVTHALDRARTDAEGKYFFHHVEPGHYRIYAQYKSRYAAGYWLIPIHVVSPTDTIKVDINNGNLEEIYNRNLR